MGTITWKGITYALSDKQLDSSKRCHSEMSKCFPTMYDTKRRSDIVQKRCSDKKYVIGYVHYVCGWGEAYHENALVNDIFKAIERVKRSKY